MIGLPFDGGRPFVLLIDGRSGAGKTTLADRIAAQHPGTTVIHLDDLYPGWDGLESGSRMLVDRVLRPLRAGRSARWRSWNWQTGRPGEWRVVHPSPLIVIEGAGSLSRAASKLADRALWLELDAATRKRRALDRDGEAYAPHWDRWAAQEARFAARERPRQRADAVHHSREFPSVE